jgi:hypothetical protein
MSLLTLERTGIGGTWVAVRWSIVGDDGFGRFPEVVAKSFPAITRDWIGNFSANEGEFLDANPSFASPRRTFAIDATIGAHIATRARSSGIAFDLGHGAAVGAGFSKRIGGHTIRSGIDRAIVAIVRHIVVVDFDNFVALAIAGHS